LTISSDDGSGTDQYQRFADGFALAVVVALPWSISASLVLIVLWLIVAIVALKLKDIRRDLTTFPGVTPVVLCLLGVLGMAWANIAWAERLGGADSFLKLLLIPLLLTQFRRSDRASWLLIGFVASCAVLLVLFWTTAIRDLVVLRGAALPLQSIKNGTTEMSEFIICGFVLLGLALRDKRRPWAAGVMALAAAFLLIAVYVLALPSRWYVTPFELVLPLIALLLLLVLRQFGIKAMLGVLAAGAIACAALYAVSPTFQTIVGSDALLGLSRPVYWPKSLRFIADAPLLGHGTGSIRSLFALAAKGQTGTLAEIATNPFQETLAVGIQLGLIGIAALWAMWISHLLLFRGDGPADWIGLVVVIYTVAASMSDSELFDAHRGWAYVFGVGIAGGAALRARMNG
jgi:O-antigen ligase